MKKSCFLISFLFLFVCISVLQNVAQAKQRDISVEEYQFALTLFPRSFPAQEDIKITDGTSPFNGAYYVIPAAIDGDIHMNMGNLFENCLANKAIFAHELTHTWQIWEFGKVWYLGQFLENHANKFCSKDPYQYVCVDSKNLKEYNAEQQAEIVKDFFLGKVCPKNIAQRRLSSTTWRIMIGSEGKDIAVGSAGQTYLVNSVGKIYVYNTDRWKQLPGSDALAIAANANKVWMVNSAGRIYEFVNNTWIQKQGSDGRDIAINSDGAIWLVNSAGRIYKYNGSSWTQMPGSAGKRIAAGNGQVWLVNSQGEIYKFNGSAWQRMPGSDGRDIAVSNDGKIWLTNTVGKIYEWNGQSWQQLDGSDGNTLSANTHKLYFVNTAGRIYYRTY